MKKFLLLVLFLVCPIELSAQQEENIINSLTSSEWKGKGQLMRSEASYSMKWEKVLSNQFLKLEFESRRKSAENKDIVFKSRAFYKITNDTIVTGTWFDNRGVSFPLNGSVKNNEMIIYWGSDTTERGKTIYRYSAIKNEIVVEDFSLNKSKYFKFANAVYKRAE